MKNLANCSPKEFLVQTNKIRKAVSKWLTDTDIMNLRKAIPSNLPDVQPDMSKEEKAVVLKKRSEMLRAQVKVNLNNILDSILEQHPDETIELLALLCFVEPQEADEHPMSEYLMSMTEMLQDESVMSFFTLLVRWEKTGILDTAKPSA